MDEYVSLPLSAMWEQRPAPIFEVPKLFLGFPGDTWWHDSSQTYQAAHSPDASPSSDSLWDLHCSPTPRKSLVPGRAPVSRRRTYTAPPSPGRGRWCPWPEPAVLVTEGSSLESTVSWTCAPHLRVLSADAGWTESPAHVQRHLFPFWARAALRSHILLGFWGKPSFLFLPLNQGLD